MSNSQYESLIRDTAAKYNIPADVAVNQMYAESGGRADAVSPAGAAGLMQFMPATMKDYGYTEQDRFDPVKSADAYGKHMSMLIGKYDGDVNKAVMAYNWGQGNLDKLGMEAAPKETRDYLSKVTGTQLYTPTTRQTDISTEPAVQQAKSAFLVDNTADIKAAYADDMARVANERVALENQRSALYPDTHEGYDIPTFAVPKIDMSKLMTPMNRSNENKLRFS
jgi:hypothetical protein